MVILHVSPHADDEMIGCPATLLTLRDSGARVVDVLLSLSAPEQRERRLGEAVEAHGQAGIELRLVDPVALPSGGGNDEPGGAAERSIATALAEHLADLQPDVVIGPQPHDLHEAHELAGRALRSALEGQSACERWWMWGIWAELSLPNLFVPFGEERLGEIVGVLGAYAGEIDRNDYRLLVKGRGLANAIVGSERVFGFGRERASSEPYAELLTEVRRAGSRWTLSAPAMYRGGSLPHSDSVTTVDDWLDESTLSQRIARRHVQQDRERFA